MREKNIYTFLLLQISILFYSMGGIFSKKAAGYPVFSFGFFFCYGVILCILFVYAIAWQQILKHMQLTVAYAFKSMTVIWGIVWGILIFHETICLKQIIGAGLIIMGIVLLASEEKE